MKTRILIVMMFTTGLSPLVGGEIVELFRKQVGVNADGSAKTGREVVANDFDALNKSRREHGVTQIGIEHTPCFGSCPVFTFIVKSDGTFRYEGKEPTMRFLAGDAPASRRIGAYTGTVSVAQFNLVAEFMKEVGFMQLEDSYTSGITDFDHVYTMAVVNGTQKVVHDYVTGPAKLRVIERMIDGLLASAKWDEPLYPVFNSIIGRWKGSPPGSQSDAELLSSMLESLFWDWKERRARSTSDKLVCDFDFQVEGEKLSGLLHLYVGDLPVIGVLSGTVSKDGTIAFTSKVFEGALMSFQGRWDRDKISFSSSINGKAMKEFVAERVPNR